MARSDDATLVIGGGTMYTAPVGTAYPTDISTVDAITAGGWEEIGHTSREDIFSMNSEGGEVTILGSLQVAELRTKRTPRSDTFRVNMIQWDTETLKFYMGANAEVDTENGLLGVPSDPSPVARAFLAVFTDGPRQFAVYTPKSEFGAGDSIDFSDTESLTTLPVDIKPLSHEGKVAWFVSPLTAAPAGE